MIYGFTIQPFLDCSKPVKADLLVVEGFIPDYALEEAIQIFNKGSYKQMLITGKKRIKGSQLDQYENDGIYSAETLIKLGFDGSKIVVIAVSDDIARDRTYQSAKAVWKWIEESGNDIRGLNLVSIGCHSRRSRLLFEKAFPPEMKVGIISVHDRTYNARKWWKTSEGFREVTGETIAYIYARFFFCPKN